MKKVINLLSIALIAFAFAACSSSNSPQGVVKAYLTAMQNNDAQAMMQTFHFNKQMADEEMERFTQMVADKIAKQNEKKQGIESFEIGEVEMAEDGQSAVVPYVVHYGDGSQQKDTQKVLLIDGKWLLDSGK